MYKVSESIIRNRIKGYLPKAKKRNIQHILTESEEKTFIQYIFDLDSQGFSPRFNIIRSMADLLCTTYHTTSVNKQWPYNFIRHRPELKTRYSRVYDFQRVLCENPAVLNVWFRLVANIHTKYAIQEEDFYNFDEIDFMMGDIYGNIVVICVDRYNKSK